VTRRDEILDESLFSASEVGVVFFASARFESLEHRDALVRVRPFIAPDLDDLERVTMSCARHTDELGGAFEAEAAPLEVRI
jgi:hypothetical protein